MKSLEKHVHFENESSRKAYYREFKKVVEAADVILEVLDARDPLGCRCPQVEQAVIQSGTNKKLVLVLNKIGRFNSRHFRELSSKCSFQMFKMLGAITGGMSDVLFHF